jgi:hypothetical protein
MRQYSLCALGSGFLAQAPDGGAPAGKPVTGPDAVPANLATTACASCHSLDRVNCRKADRDTRATTVSRMKCIGAVLTDEQVPLVADYLTRVAGARYCCRKVAERLTVSSASPSKPSMMLRGVEGFCATLTRTCFTASLLRTARTSAGAFGFPATYPLV